MRIKGIKVLMFKVLLERRIKLYEKTGLLRKPIIEEENKPCGPEDNCHYCEVEPIENNNLDKMIEEMSKTKEEPKVYQK